MIDNKLYLEKGNGEPIILLHGLFGALSNWKTVVNQFAKTHRVIIPKIPLTEVDVREANLESLTDFVSLCIDEIDKKTTVVILGDARNNFGPEKAHLMKIINERSKQVFWLNPEGKYRWDTGDSVMTTYSAYCTKVFQCGNIDQLERVISTLLKTAI